MNKDTLYRIVGITFYITTAFLYPSGGLFLIGGVGILALTSVLNRHLHDHTFGILLMTFFATGVLHVFITFVTYVVLDEHDRYKIIESKEHKIAIWAEPPKVLTEEKKVLELNKEMYWKAKANGCNTIVYKKTVPQFYKGWKPFDAIVEDKRKEVYTPEYNKDTK